MPLAKAVSVVVPQGAGQLTNKAVGLLTQEIRRRSGARVVLNGEADAILVLALDPTVGAEGYRIGPAPATEARTGNTCIVGGDERGLLYGIGKYLRTCRFHPTGFEPSAWRGTSVPTKSIRGMYFATHFGNFYEAAPIAQVERYVEELALWGCNTLSVWFDMHQYRGLDDPAAQQMIDRLRRILQTANTVGIRGALTTLANEGYADSPEHLRADWTAGHDGYTRQPGGHYHVELCPSQPDGLRTILQTRDEVLRAFQGLDIAYIWIWPYDQGGCTCSECAPWGANGFVRTAEPVADLIRSRFPDARVVLSTWYFDHFTQGEWQGLARLCAEGAPPWIDMLLAGDAPGFPQFLLDHGIPGDLPVVSFPEISMDGNWPWGGYGAIPRPGVWQSYEQRNGGLLAGAFPYSEGIYEDLNKAVNLQLGWDPDQESADIVREYTTYEFSPAVAEDVVTLVDHLEGNLGHTLNDSVRDQVADERVHTSDDLMGHKLYQAHNLTDAHGVYEMAEHIRARLPQWASVSWRWRILWLRAALDWELQRHAGTATELTERFMDELTTIYCADHAQLQVAPPSCKTLYRIIKHDEDLIPG